MGLVPCAVVVLAGCAGTPPSCPPPARAMIRETLYFGLRLPSGAPITADDWQAFLADTITPRFPAGYTVLDAAGHWRDAAGRGVEEPSKMLVVLHPATDEAGPALAEIAATYRERFAQEAVLHESGAVCAHF